MQVQCLVQKQDKITNLLSFSSHRIHCILKGNHTFDMIAFQFVPKGLFQWKVCGILLFQGSNSALCCFLDLADVFLRFISPWHPTCSPCLKSMFCFHYLSLKLSYLNTSLYVSMLEQCCYLALEGRHFLCSYTVLVFNVCLLVMQWFHLEFWCPLAQTAGVGLSCRRKTEGGFHCIDRNSLGSAPVLFARQRLSSTLWPFLRFIWLKSNREERGEQWLREYLEQMECTTYNFICIQILLFFWYS